MEQFNLFSEVESTVKKNKSGRLADNQIAVYFNTKSKTYYIRFNPVVSAVGLTKKVLKPIFNNLTGEVYLVFADDALPGFESGFPVSDNGGSSTCYVFARQLCEWLFDNLNIPNPGENYSEVWTISGNISINPNLAAYRIEKH